MASPVDLMGCGQTVWASVRGGHDGLADQGRMCRTPQSVGNVVPVLVVKPGAWMGRRIMLP